MVERVFDCADVDIPHDALVRLRADRKVKLGISESVARVISTTDLKPTRTTAGGAFVFWQVVAFGLFGYTVYLSFTAAWWWFLVGLLAASVIVRANAGANQLNLLDAAMVDRNFYERARELGGWSYKMDESDAEPFLTDDMRVGRAHLKEAGLPLR